MPGAFHVEAVSDEGRLRVYLLDMQFQAPLVANSSLAAKLRQDGATSALECGPAGDEKAFACPLPEGSDLQRGTLIIEASRDGLPAEPAEYELPLAWSK